MVVPESHRRTALLLGAFAFVLRLPAVFAPAHLTFDDGVFGASAVAMRHGGVPFRDVFSSQGPLFLPLVWLADTLGFHTRDAPRFLTLAAGVAITVLVYVIGRRLAGSGVGVLAALATTASGSVLWTSGPLAADGPGLALALGAVAVLLAHRDDPTTAKAITIGALIGAAFAVKSLFAVPPGVAVAWVLLEQRDWRRLTLALAAAAAVVLASAAPFGFADVWDQAVDYHLDAAGTRTPWRNASKVVSTLWDRDLLPLALFLTGLASVVLRRRRRVAEENSTDAGPRWGGRAAPITAWLCALVLLLVLEHPLWRPHLSHLVPPLAILGAYTLRHHLRIVTFGMAVVAVAHGASNTAILWPDGYSGLEAQARDTLAVLPDDAFAISDEPGYVWRAGLQVPDDLVDTSILRIDSGRLTAASLIDAATTDDRVCAVLVWSRRFADLDVGPGLVAGGYDLAQRYGGDRALYLRPCH